MRSPRPILLIIFSVLALFVTALLWIIPALQYGIDDAYAEWGAADMVIAYMEAHNGQWPRNWDALKPQFDAGGGRVGGSSFEEYCQRIHIDFNADPAALKRQSLSSNSPPFNVIWATKRTGTHFGDGPNKMLHNYFRSTPRNAPTSVVASQPDR